MAKSNFNREVFDEFFKIIPKVIENETTITYCYEYETQKFSFRLIAAPKQNLISVSLYEKKAQFPFVDFVCIVRGEIQNKTENKFSRLVFNDCIIGFANFFLVDEEEIYNNEKYPKTTDFQIQILPHFLLSFE